MAPPAGCTPPHAETHHLFDQSRWYALCTKPFRESFAATQVKERGLEVLFPCLQRAAPMRRSRPLFPGYIFARFRPVNDLLAVRNTPGITHIVGACNQPAPVPDAIIAELKERRQDPEKIPVAQNALRVGDKVQINAGPLRGLIASLERECDDRLRVQLLLNAIGHVRLCIDKGCLQPAS